MRADDDGGGAAPDRTPSRHRLQQVSSFEAAAYSSHEQLTAHVHALGLKALDWETAVFNQKLMRTLAAVKRRPTEKKKPKGNLQGAIKKSTRKQKKAQLADALGLHQGSKKKTSTKRVLGGALGER